MSRYRVKVVERAGEKLERLLVKSDPFEGASCGREECVLCRNPENGKCCNRRNLVYRATCVLCERNRDTEKAAATDRGETDYVPKNIVAEYIEESGRSIFRRGKEHLDLWRRQNESSFMMKHLVPLQSRSLGQTSRC